MVVYLPIAFLKDWICGLLGRSSLENCVAAVGEVSSPLKYIGGQKFNEMELRGILNKKTSDSDLSNHDEELPLVSKRKEDVIILKSEKELTTREIATYGMFLAPIWFVTEVRNFPSFIRIFL